MEESKATLSLDLRQRIVRTSRANLTRRLPNCTKPLGWSALCLRYIREVLCPTLKQGDIVVLENLALHKCPQVVALVQAEGAEVRLLPAYSPDLNAIEKMWSKIKASLRSSEARTPEELDRAIS